MRPILARLLLLSLPLAALCAVELALPLDAFTFRIPEALLVRERLPDTPAGRLLKFSALPGPFFPDRHLVHTDVGDLGHHTPYQVPFRSEWRTDHRGFRVDPALPRPELVVVGDSNVAGMGLTQEDTLARVLHRDHGIPTYPYATATVQAFLTDPAFGGRRPAFLIVESVERDVVDTYQVRDRRTPFSGAIRWVDDPRLREPEVALSRLLRMNVLEYLRARVNGRARPIALGGQLFLKGAPALRAPPRQRIEAAASTLQAIVAEARAAGMQAAVLVVPDKETIYRDLLPGAPPAVLLPELRAALAARGVPFIDLEGPFLAARARGEAPYLSDDTHWNAGGVRLAAERVAAWVAAQRGQVAP